MKYSTYFVVEAFYTTKVTYHIDYANELEIKHHFDRISPSESGMVVFVVILK